MNLLKMGNAQSAISPRRSHRLSKPPTNTSSSNLLTAVAQHPDNGVHSFPISISADFDDNEAVNTSSTGERRSRRDSRQKLRSHLFGADSESLPRDSIEEETNNCSGIGSLVNGVKGRLSRSGSLISQLPSARGSATHLINSLSASRRSLALESTLPDLDESNRMLQEIKDKAENDEWAARNHGTSPVDETSAQDFPYTPIRRRSLLTPGIATRIPLDILRKPPPPDHLLTQADRDYYFNPQYPESSPLSQLESLDLAEEEWIPPVRRTETPCELDYSHLGGLKLGTLRIMNGCASPAPSDLTPGTTPGINRRRSSPDLKKDEDYFTASEGHASGDEALYTNNDSFRPAKGDNIGMSTSRAKLIVPRTPRSGSPLKYERREEGFFEVGGSMDVSLQPPPSTSNPLALFEFPSWSPDRASYIAHEYMSELPDSPFSFENTPAHESSTLEATSKNTEFDDELFEDEGIVTSPLETYDILRTETASCNSNLRRGQEIYYQDASQSPDSPAKTTLSKADSGYSSTSSLRSVRNGWASKSQEVKDSIAIESTIEPRASPAEILKGPGAEVVRPGVTLSKPATRAALPTRPSILVKPKPATAPAITTVSTFRGSSETVATLSSTKSMPTEGEYGQKKLRKPRPLSQPVPAKYITVQGYRELSQSHIPPIPSEVAAKHAARLQEFPVLEHTYPSLHHTRSNSTCSSILPQIVPIRFPSPGPNALNGRTLPNLPVKESKKTGNTAPRHPPHRDYSTIKPSKAERRSSCQRAPGQCGLVTTMATIADFGTVTESLGRGPYDAARSVLPAKLPKGADNRHLSLPHNISSTMPRARSMTGMDAVAAAELARLRSKTIVERDSLSWAEKQKLFNDRGGIPGKHIRPSNLVLDAPPVPSPPTAEEVEQKELQRPSSEHARTPVRPTASRSKTEVSEKYLPSNKLVKNKPQQTPTLTKDSHTAAIEFHKSWEPHRQAWRLRRKSAGDGLLANRSTSAELDHPEPPPHRSGIASLSNAQSLKPGVVEVDTRSRSPIGRYNGGFSHGYEPDAGVGGSAGTRKGIAGTSRKGLKLSEGYGINLSDVPIVAGICRIREV